MLQLEDESLSKRDRERFRQFDLWPPVAANQPPLEHVALNGTVGSKSSPSIANSGGALAAKERLLRKRLRIQNSRPTIPISRNETPNRGAPGRMRWSTE